MHGAEVLRVWLSETVSKNDPFRWFAVVVVIIQPDPFEYHRDWPEHRLICGFQIRFEDSEDSNESESEGDQDVVFFRMPYRFSVNAPENEDAE